MKYTHIHILKDGLQVRITANFKEHSKFFAKSLGDQALPTAIAWRDSMYLKLGEPLVSGLACKSNNISTGVRGVTSYINVDNRRADCKSFRFGVRWYDAEGKPKTRSFQVGTLGSYSTADELHAFKVAISFRLSWELGKDSGEAFDPLEYRDWKKWSSIDIPLLTEVTEILKKLPSKPDDLKFNV